MKINKTLTALIAGASISMSGQVLAATASGTPISNTATLSFDVNGTAVSDISTTATFAVDTLVSMTLSSDNGPTGDAGSDVNLIYTLTNTTNGPMYFNLGGGSGYTLDSGSTGAVISSGIAYLALEGDSLTFSFDETIADDAVDGASVDVEVTATAAESDGTILENSALDKNDVAVINVAQVVLADAGNTNYDAIIEATATYSVTSAHITSSKTVTVDTDATFGTFAIPGNTVTYSVLVESDGTNAATGIIFSDVLDTANLDQDSITNIVVTDNDNVTVLAAGTDYVIVNDASASSTTPGTLQISLPDIPTGNHLTVDFTVTIL